MEFGRDSKRRILGRGFAKLVLGTGLFAPFMAAAGCQGPQTASSGVEQSQRRSEEKSRPNPPVAEPWGTREAPAAADTGPSEETLSGTASAVALNGGAERNDSVATVNGEPIGREEWSYWLTRSYGMAILNELVVLHEAQHLAERLRLTVSQEDVDEEYHLLLEKMGGAVASSGGQTPNRAETVALLEKVLSRQGKTLSALELGLKRNAYLRAVVERDLEVPPAAIRVEFERQYGTRARIRFIWVDGFEAAASARYSSAAEFDTEFERLESAPAPGVRTGEIGPFGKGDPEVPRVVWQTAFQIGTDGVSAPLRITDGYLVIRVLEIKNGGEIDLESVREELYRTVKHQMAEPRMQELYQKLLGEARISIQEQALLESLDTER